MAKGVLTHNVADVDVDKWLSFKDERAASIGQMMGGTTMEVAADGSKAVAVSCESENVGVALAAVASPSHELQAQFEKHGVLPPFGAYVAG
ncbi:MAG TPA: hypothetical protein VG346_04535 [Acidimicrobiales bacterium]|jgi:hypothetical protein|nr:hypothetical protein [Acidimicrobiales bacterium]